MATHTGVGHGAVKPSGRTVHHSVITDVAYVNPSQYYNTEVIEVLSASALIPYNQRETITITDDPNQVLNPYAANGTTHIGLTGNVTSGTTMVASTSMPEDFLYATGVAVSTTSSGDNNATWFITSEGTGGLPVVGGDTYTFWVWTYNTSGLSFGIRPIEWNSSGGLVSDDGTTGTTLVESIGNWKRYTRTVTLQSATAYVSYRVLFSGVGSGYITAAKMLGGTG